MNYDIRITPEQLHKAAEWATAGMADVELALDDRMLLAEQGDERMAWDTAGEPATDAYLDANPPLDPTGDDREQVAFIVRPPDPLEDVALFAREVDALAFWQTYVDEGASMGDIERGIVCGPDLAAKMIADRKAGEDDD